MSDQARDYNVYGLGNALLDLQLHASEHDLATLGLSKGGMSLVDVEGLARILDHFSAASPHMASGGSVANTMIAISQLGGRGAFSCLVGDDAHGRHYRTEMEELGITVHTEPVPEGATGTCVVLITPDAERTMSTSLGVNADFGPENVSADLVACSDWVYIEGYLFSTEKGRAAVRRALELAQAAGTRVALTFSDSFIVESFGEPLRDAVRRADLVFANHIEARAFTEEEDEDEVFAKVRTAAPNVIMTLHERGARADFGGQEHFFEPFKVEAVDATGAGDMFAGGMLYGITNEHTVPEAGRLACFLASRVVSQLGPRLQADMGELLKELDTPMAAD